MVKLKEITKKSWLVLTDDKENIGLLNEGLHSFTFVGKDVKTTFKNRQEIVEFFKQKDLFENTVEKLSEVKTESFINGFPVDYDKPAHVDLSKEGINLPVYSKTDGSDSMYCAGYYVIHFPKGPIHSYCPRLSTLKKYKYEGPFKTDMEMKAVLSSIRRKIK